MLDEKKTRRKLRKARKELRELKALSNPLTDKMVKEPEVKKGIWDALIARGRDIQSGELTEIANKSCAIGRGIGHE